MDFPGKTADLLKENFLPALLCVIVPAVLFPALHNGFVDWDDVQYVVSNRALRGGWLDVFTFFSGYYHPLTVLTYKIEFSLFGLDPLPYHFTSLLLHTVNCVSVFYLFSALGARPPSAFLGALLFGIHPVHVEPVAWISGRKELLWGMFAFWSLLCYLRFLDGRGRKFMWWSLFLFLPAALSKPAALVLPFVILLLDHYRGRVFDRRLLAEKIPYLLLALIVFALSSAPSGFLLEGGTSVFSFSGTAAAALQSALFYLGKLAAPVSLSALYPPLQWPLSPGSRLLPAFLAVLFIAGLFLISGRAGGLARLVCRRINLFPSKGLFAPTGQMSRSVGASTLNEGASPGWRKKTGFALLFFLVTAFPGFIVSPPADRYVYVPSAGLFFLYGEFVLWLYRFARGRRDPRPGLRAGFPAPALALLVAAHFFVLAGVSYSRTSVWKDSLTLWSEVMEKNPLEYMAYYGRGNAYQASGGYEAALADFTRCLEINPGYWKALSNRGRVFAEMKKFDKAAADYGAAISLNPSSAQLFLNRGNAYLLNGNYALAVKDYDRALALVPGFAPAAENRRAALVKRPAGR